MAKLRFTKEAVNDLSQIWDYTFESWSERQADDYYQMIMDCCGKLAANPLLGRAYAEVAEDLRGIHAGRHLIFYHVSREDGVLVVRILHDSMDLKRRIGE